MRPEVLSRFASTSQSGWETMAKTMLDLDSIHPTQPMESPTSVMLKVQTTSLSPAGLFPFYSIAVLAAHIITMHPERAKRDRAGKLCCTCANAKPHPCTACLSSNICNSI